MNPGQGFLAGAGFETPPQHSQAVPGQAMQSINLVAPQNTPPVCTGVSVPCRITVTNRYGEPREVIVQFHLPAQTPEHLKFAIENLIAMGFNIPAQRPFERNNQGPRNYHDDSRNSPRPFRPSNY